MSEQIKHNGSTVRRVLKLIRPYAGLVALTLTLAAYTYIYPCWRRFSPARQWT